MLSFLLHSLVISNTFITPNSTHEWYINQKYDIQWDLKETVNIQMQLFDIKSQKWVSHFGDDSHFLSTIIDKDTQYFNWEIPAFLSSFWEYPKRITAKSLETDKTFNSDNFTIPGLTINQIPDITGNSLNINWNTNHKNFPYQVFLLKPDTTFFNFNKDINIQILSNQVIDTNFNWNNINIKETTSFKIGVICGSNLTWGISNQFKIIRTTTSTTTTPTQTTTTTKTQTTTTTKTHTTTTTKTQTTTTTKTHTTTTTKTHTTTTTKTQTTSTITSTTKTQK